MVFDTHGGTRNRTRDIQKKGPAFTLSSDHLTTPDPYLCMWPRRLSHTFTRGAKVQQRPSVLWKHGADVSAPCALPRVSTSWS